MITTTANSMNFLGMKNDDFLSLKIPRKMRDLIREQARLNNMTDSNYVKMALQDRLEKDIAETA